MDYAPTHTGTARFSFPNMLHPDGERVSVKIGDRVSLAQSAYAEDIFYVVGLGPRGWAPLTLGSPSFTEFAAMAHVFEDVRRLQPPAPPAPAPATTAPALLDAAAGHMKARAATYDAPEGERSMGRAVAALNALLGRVALTESEGWLLLQLLKDARDRTRQTAHRDSLEDGIAYAALKAEARLAETTEA